MEKRGATSIREKDTGVNSIFENVLVYKRMALFKLYVEIVCHFPSRF